MTARQTTVAVLAAFSSGDREVTAAAVDMLEQHSPLELVTIIAGLTGVALAVTDRLADELNVDRADLLRFYLTSLGEFAATPPDPGRGADDPAHPRGR